MCKYNYTCITYMYVDFVLDWIEVPHVSESGFSRIGDRATGMLFMISLHANYSLFLKKEIFILRN